MFSPGHLHPMHPRCMALQLLDECGITAPPVPEQVILDYFEAGLDRRPLASVPDAEALLIMPNPLQGFLATDPNRVHRPRVWVSPELSVGRARWTLYHEIAHLDIPSHFGPWFYDDERALRPATGRDVRLPRYTRTAAYQGVLPVPLGPSRGDAFEPREVETAESVRSRQQEYEANQYAAELIMPSPIFFPEARELPIGVATIDALSRRYIASFEATALRYAQACPEQCAAFAAEPLRDADGGVAGFEIVYARRARRFPIPLRAGLTLTFSGLLAEAWQAQGPVTGHLTGDDLGLGQTLTLSADALKLGRYERVVVVLWLESGQLTILDEEDYL